MAVKTITIKDGVYRKLLALKRKDESFSNLFDRLISSQKNIEILKELRGTINFKDKSALLKELHTKRKEQRFDTP